jgi:hypothetical protein
MRYSLSSEFNTFCALDVIYRFEIHPSLHVFDIIFEKKLTLLSFDTLTCSQLLER